MRASSGARNTRSRARAKIFAQEPEQSEFTPARVVRARRSACGSRMHKATHEKMDGVPIPIPPPEPAATPSDKGRAADTPVKNPPARLGARDVSNHDPALTVETPKSVVLRRSTRKIPVVSHFPPVETKRSRPRPARRVKERVNRDSGAIVFRPEIDFDIPTEFEESNVRADLTSAYPLSFSRGIVSIRKEREDTNEPIGRPAFPVGRGGG